MRTRILTLALFLAAILLAPIGGVEACGPFFEPDVFVSNTIPDDLAAFAKGQLGILQAGYDSNEYAVAFRYLNGGKLSNDEQAAYVPLSQVPRSAYDQENPSPQQTAALQAAEQPGQQDAQLSAQWFAARAKYQPAPPPTNPQPPSATADGNYVEIGAAAPNCPGAAFANATLTLFKRAATWGAQSAYLVDWNRGQDAVFSNCAGANATMPAPALSNAPPLLKADRDYQIAAALFYAHRYDEAIKQFSAIAADKTSPWNTWGHYLAARATVRLAFGLGKATDPYSSNVASYDAATMQRAQQMLEALLARLDPTPSRAIVQNELNFVLVRTEPEKRADDLSVAFAGPQHDANFALDLQDLSWVLQHEGNARYSAPLVAWIAAWRSGSSASVFATWQQTHALPWFVVAIAKASPSDLFVPQLLDEAVKISPDSPAYDTVFYHRVRLLIALKRTDEARALLDAALPALRKQKPSSKQNAFLGERMAVARNFNEFLQFAPRTTLEAGSEGFGDLLEKCRDRAHPADAPCPEANQPLEFDQDAVGILNRQMPLSLLIRAAQSHSLPQNLREQLTLITWARAVLLGDGKTVSAIAPALPKTLFDTAGSSIDFPADLAILRNPGIRPYLEPGIPRVASFSIFDELRDNGWCKTWDDGYEAQQQTPAPLQPPAFFTPDQSAQAAAEYQRMMQMPDSSALIGQRVLDYAKDHPGDPEVPEALALTVRATHYGCQTWDPNVPAASRPKYQPVSKAAFDFLHQHYPKSPWTAKTPYYY